MRRLLKITVTYAVFMIVAVPIASAHGPDPRGGRVDDQMKKLHAIMPMFSLASAELESAIEKGDAAEIKVQADRIIAAVPDLKSSKPHKNRKQIALFKSIAAQLGADVTAIGLLAEKGDFTSSAATFKKMESRCVQCHARFRD